MKGNKVLATLFVLQLLILLCRATVCAEQLSEPSDVQVFITKGLEEYSQKNYYDAIDSFQQAFVLQDNNPNLLYKIGKSFEKLGKPQNAQYYYLRAIDVNPQYVPALYNLAVLNDFSNNLTKAVLYYNRAIQADTRLFYGYYNLANVYYREHKYQVAITNYQKAIKYNEQFADAYYNLATLYRDIDQNDEARKYFKKYSDLNPSDEEVKSILEALK